MTTAPQIHRGQFIQSLSEGDQVVEHYRVVRKVVRTSRRGDPYLDFDLVDRTGRINAKIFGQNGSTDVVSMYSDLFEAGDIVRVDGYVEMFNGKPQLIVKRLRLSAEGEVDESLFERASERPLEDMERELADVIGSLENDFVRRLAGAVFGDEEFYKRFLVAPAATRLHHAYRSGLIEHTLSLIAAADRLLPAYPEIDRDTVVGALLFHDCGKTEELGERAGDEYSVEGTMVGHVYLGTRRVERAMDAIPDFPRVLRLQILHCILSHHGSREFGAPVEPASLEAIFVHHLDNLDAKIANARSALASDVDTKSAFTDPSLAGAVFQRYFKGEAFLDPEN